MSVVDFPRPSKGVPLLGTFVVVALDPVASLAVLGDELVEIAAERIKTRKRIVLVDFSLDGDFGLSFYRYHPVGSGLPRDTWQSIPVEPASAHPQGRPPIACSKPLPISNPYVYTTESFQGEVSRIYTAQPSGIHCTTEDLRRVSRQFWEDLARIQLGPREAGANGAGPATDGQYFTDPWEGRAQTFMQPMYQMWLHVDENESYADAGTLQEEIAELCAIETEWRERREADTKAKRERLQFWRDDVDTPSSSDEEDEGTESELEHEDAFGEDIPVEEEAATNELIHASGCACTNPDIASTAIALDDACECPANGASRVSPRRDSTPSQ